jgi:epoxyqueuosine reductase
MPSPDHEQLVQSLRVVAADEGFVEFGIAPAIDATGFNDLVRWIDSGYAADMSYFADRKEAYKNPAGVLEGAKSLIVLAFPYDSAARKEVRNGDGRVARYAWSGEDYHDVVHPKLKRICQHILQHQPTAKARGVIDTAPLLEREFAQVAGLGWRGKNTLLLNKKIGSYFFLACVLTDLVLPLDEPHESSHCGTCTACLDACPTGAFPEPGVLDASRCISYLTIEHRDTIHEDLRDGIGDWLFGCDVCQDVCPWNRKPIRNAISDRGPMETIELASLFTCSDEDFRRRFRKTPMWRTRRRGLLRNAAIVLGNQGDMGSIKQLEKTLGDDDAIVRDAAEWAIAKIQKQT